MKASNSYRRSGLAIRRAAALAGAVLAATATATPVGIGTTVNLAGTSTVADPYLKGVIVKNVNHAIVLNVTGGTMPAVFPQRVVRETVAGTLDFYFWFEMSKLLTTPTIARAPRGTRGRPRWSGAKEWGASSRWCSRTRRLATLLANGPANPSLRLTPRTSPPAV
ncbi:MAG: hypothetical protein ACYC96_11920 [Fimbriimonadaceae bacterium]